MREKEKGLPEGNGKQVQRLDWLLAYNINKYTLIYFGTYAKVIRAI